MIGLSTKIKGKPVRLEVQQFGEAEGSDQGKPDVVLIHGTGADHSIWKPQIDILSARGYRSFLPELRGHGLTDEPGELTDINVHIQDLLDTLEGCPVRFPAVFVGHSLGAIIAISLAQQQPQLFEQILAVSLPGRVPRLVSTLFSLVLCAPFEMLRGTLLHRSLPYRERLLIETERHSLEQIVEHFAEVNFVDHPPKLACPVHLAVGRFDVVAPYIYVERIQRSMPNSSLRIFEWAGHNCMDDQPGQFNRWFLEKLERHSRQLTAV